MTADLHKLRALSAAATPVPWIAAGNEGFVYSIDREACERFRRVAGEDAARYYRGACVGEGLFRGDMDLICAMRNSLESLLDEIDVLRRACNALHHEADAGRRLAEYVRASNTIEHAEAATNPSNGANLRRLVGEVVRLPLCPHTNTSPIDGVDYCDACQHYVPRIKP